MVKKIKHYFKKNKKLLLYKLIFRITNKTILRKLLSSRVWSIIEYYINFEKDLNLYNPQTFNEKLQWLKLYDRKPEYTKMVDKYEVRKYIAKVIGEEYLVPLLGVYDRFEDINFDKLPNQFVLKPNHTSGDVFICKDKHNIDYDKLKKEVNRWLKRNYYWVHREWPYKNIKPKILCEKFLANESGEELKDYKFMCFNGKVKCSFVCLNRHSLTGLNVDFYDMDWKPMPFERRYPNSGIITPKPKNFKEMIRLSEILSKDVPFLRVDFYEVNGKLYFGELTLYPGAGFEEFTPESYDYLLGSWLQLPNKEAK